MPLYICGSISSRWALTQKVIDEMVIVYYIFDGKLFSEFLNVQIILKFWAIFEKLSDSLFITAIDTSKNNRSTIGEAGHDENFE